jgi:GDPmannose 4,6-dehydratase
MKAIIFGASGQDGNYLSALLIKQGYEVIGISRRDGYLQTDISDFNQVLDLISQHKPDYIFHLAANSTTQQKHCLKITQLLPLVR